jgi:hypothetical protein
MTTERKTTYNSTFAIGGVSCSADSLVVAESSVLRINFCGKRPAHRKSAKRCVQFFYKEMTEDITVIKNILNGFLNHQLT